jgi:hypothetical protein
MYPDINHFTLNPLSACFRNLHLFVVCAQDNNLFLTLYSSSLSLMLNNHTSIFTLAFFDAKLIIE